MTKTGLGNTGNDKNVNVSTRGLIDVLSVEIIDGSGTQIGGSGGLPVINQGNVSVASGNRTVTTAGTSVQLSVSSVPCKKLIIQSMYSNQGNVYVGGPTVSSSNGLVLYPGAATIVNLTPSNLNQIYIDAATNGEGVVYYYEN